MNSGLHAGNDELDWEEATHGLSFIQDDANNLVDGPIDVAIERLLWQIALRGRAAYLGEDAQLRRAIACYAANDVVGAYTNAMHAAATGNSAFSFGLGGFGEPADDMPLEEALAAARAARQRQ